MTDEPILSPVFALSAHTPPALGDSTLAGYLLFPSEQKARAFIEICSHPNTKTSGTVYAVVGEMAVSDFLRDTVTKKKSFYVPAEHKDQCLPAVS